jgi:hypothetical protein
MHKRKAFLIYPPNYKPGDGFKLRHSKFQAWKVAIHMGGGACVDVCVKTHPARGSHWTSSIGPKPLWEVANVEFSELAASCQSAGTPGSAAG